MATTSATPPYDLNIGAGHSHIPGFINIDIDERADVTLDLSSERLPFPDNSVRTIFSHSTLEHVPDFLFALGEIHRVLEHDGVLLLGLPYVTLTEHHLVNPYHLHNFSERTFDLFDPALLKSSAAEGGDVAFRRVFVRFRYMGYFGLAPRPLRAWARRHLFNVVRNFDIGLVAIKDPDRDVDVSERRGAELRARFEELARARRLYDGVQVPTVALAGAGSFRFRVSKRLQPYRERRTD
jgi:SAM-dependent methyltransferase